MYGNGATYDSIEGRFRIIKKEAANLKAEIDNGVRAEAPPRGVGNSTPSKCPCLILLMLDSRQGKGADAYRA